MALYATQWIGLREAKPRSTALKNGLVVERNAVQLIDSTEKMIRNLASYRILKDKKRKIFMNEGH